MHNFDIDIILGKAKLTTEFTEIMTRLLEKSEG